MSVLARPQVVDSATSSTWEGAAPAIAALVSTYSRAGFLIDLLGCLERQDQPVDDFEVVLVDNGSTDDTWTVLSKLVSDSPLRAMALRLDRNNGPAPGRNAGAAATRAPLIAITDDDCLPTPGWLREVRSAFASGADVVQGAVHPDPATVADMGPWDHTKWVRAQTPFFETCNVSYRRSAFERVGGFDEDDPLLHPPSGRAFGEDACLAWAVQETGGQAAFAPRALVHHRCIPSNFSRWLADQRELAGFPGLARRSPLVARWLHRGIFLDRRSEAYDLGLLGLAVASASRRWWPLLLVLPWAARRVGAARHHGRTFPEQVELLGRYAWSDTVAFTAMAKGTVKHRRLVL